MYLTSLLEMSVVDINRRLQPIKVELESEPAFCGLGPEHAAVGMNNQVGGPATAPDATLLLPCPCYTAPDATPATAPPLLYCP